MFEETPAMEAGLEPALEADLNKALEIAKAGAIKLQRCDAEIAKLMSDRSEILPVEMTIYQDAISNVESIQHELMSCAKLKFSVWKLFPVALSIVGAALGTIIGSGGHDVIPKLYMDTDDINGIMYTQLGLGTGVTAGYALGSLIKRRMDKVGVTRDTKWSRFDQEPKHAAAYLAKVDKPLDQFTDHEARALITAINDDFEIKKMQYENLDNSFGEAARTKFTAKPGDHTLRFRFD